jgi:hypothetical protein
MDLLSIGDFIIFLKIRIYTKFHDEKIGGSSLLKNKAKNEKMVDRLLKLPFS